MGENDDDKQGQAGQLFENFIQATTCKGTLQAFNILTRQLDLDPKDYRHFYSKLKTKVTSWKAKALWNKLDKRYSQKEYQKGKACVGTKCLIIGGGPCGLRTAIELSCLGAKVVVVEKRDTFSRNNVLHLWPYTIHDLRCLGAKKFYGKFCAGAIDHISIWQLQLMLFKIALLHGIEIHVNIEFVKLLEPPEDQENQKIGWRAEYLPQDHPLSGYEFDVIIGADGRRNTLAGFKRKEFRGKLAIAITANFVNRNTTAEAKVEEISGVAFIFNQKFFQDLKEETGIDLENIVYYKDSTHYFVMTAKKQSLLDKGVILNDCGDAEMLLCAENVDQENLQSYAREAADFATNYQLPSLDFAINHYGLPDVAMFDFTSMYASDNAALVRERRGHPLLVALVGDSLLEPFWPMGTGCARGFLAAFDTAWMVRSWSQGTQPLELLAERESIYRLLPQTTPENISKNFDQYTIDPGTRYPNLNSSCVRTHQVKHLYLTGELHGCPLERASSIRRSVGITRHESDIRPNKLLTWCQKQTEAYRNVNVTNLTSSWKSGLALCAIIHHFRPDLIDFYSLNEDDAVRNNQLAFDMAEKEFGISPITTGKEMASTEEPDKLSMVLYLSKFYELFRGTPLRPVDSSLKDKGKNGHTYSSKQSSLLTNNYLNLTLPRKRVPKGENKSEENDLNKRRRRTAMQLFDEAVNLSRESINSGAECSDTKEVINQNKVKSMATQLLAKFEENAPNSSLRRQGSLRKEFPPNIGGSDTCYFCKKRVYVVERLSAEGHFFHRECFKCSFCSSVLRLGNHVFNMEEGKFYCQPHFMHSGTFSSSNQRKRRTDSKAQDPDKAWKKEEAITAEVTTDSPCSAGSSSEDSSPDEPSSPKKSRSDSFFKLFKRRNSSVSTEWKSVRIGPEEETADNNLLAVRVMVLSDESSSDAEKRPEENHGKLHRRRLSSRKKKEASASGNNREAGNRSKAADALVRASTLPNVAPNKSQRWRQKIQSTFPLLIAKRLSHVSSTSSPDDEVFHNNTSEHFNEPHIETQRAPEEEYHAIPSYKPHHKVLLANRTALRHEEQGSSAPSPPLSNHQYYSQKNMLDGYRDINIGNDPFSGNISDHNDVFEKDKKQDKGSKQDKSIQEEGNPQNPTLKKLVLSNEEKTKLLDWSATKPRPPVKDVNEKIQNPSNVNHDPGGEADNKGKSAFTILSNAIKRSFSRSYSSTPDSPKNISSAKTKPVSPTGYLDLPGSFFRRSQSNLESFINPSNSEKSFTSSNHLPSSHFDFKASTDGSSWTSGYVSSQKNKQDLSKVEDMPKMLEKFSIRENNPSSASCDLPLRNRRGSFFSSLRLTNKTSETPSNVPPQDSWYAHWSFRRKVNEKEAEQKPHTSSIAASNLQTMSQPAKDVRVTKSENYSSCSEEECVRRHSAVYKSTQTSKQQRKMEREARMRAKQEELKRLHKAQTIQRQLQETEEKQRALDIQGIKLEKALRGETDSGAQDDARLLRDWFQLALEKSKLNRYESELLSVARELDLEDQQGRLEQQLREKMMIDPALKDEKDVAEEEEIFAEMMRVIEQRDQLVTRIEEQRLRDYAEEKNPMDVSLPKDWQPKASAINKGRFI
ncbi:F-actin-monooxygenase MICAL2 isoform X5 [Hyla sarda]|uniref:F-actin-monooxygenase MICAL2 isoform X5 n=1 Tax=Hyla sarda TaxID=327740 RepID=UPI0024C46D1C|nr:F-actin-monooxygenase MICAL2 isoform X5 [Hyla sarda]